MDGLNRIFLASHEKALTNMKNTRKDNTIFIELSTQLKQMSVVPTVNSFKYDVELDSARRESSYKSSSKKKSFFKINHFNYLK